MLKLIGSILILVSATLLGVFQAEEIQKRYRALLTIQKMIYGIESEIRYKRIQMKELFLHLQKTCEEPYKSWCIYMVEALEKKDGSTFAEKWKETAVIALSDSGLTQRDLVRFSELGKELESIDIQMQVDTLHLYLQEVEQEITELRREKRLKMNVRYCLGITGGIVLVMIFL